jgi:hypothetical protein
MAAESGVQDDLTRDHQHCLLACACSSNFRCWGGGNTCLGSPCHQRPWGPYECKAHCAKRIEMIHLRFGPARAATGSRSGLEFVARRAGATPSGLVVALYSACVAKTRGLLEKAVRYMRFGPAARRMVPSGCICISSIIPEDAKGGG